MKTSYLNDKQLPLVMQPVGADPGSNSLNALCDFIGNSRDEFVDALMKNGAILFRGFAPRTAEDFSQVLNTMTGSNDATDDKSSMPVVTRRGVATDGNKSQVLSNVYTSTEQPPQHWIPQHNEDSFTVNPPKRIVFFCVQPAEQGGETPLADSHAVYEALKPDVVEQFDEHDGVKYVRFLFSDIPLVRFKPGNVVFSSWQQVFGTEDRDEVNQLCDDNGIQCRWNRFGGMQTIVKLPAVAKHPVSGEALWFNQVHIYNPTRRLLSGPQHTAYKIAKQLLAPNRFTFASFGDDLSISADVLDRINHAYDEHTIKFPWQTGDLLVVDNYRVSHGRMPFQGPRRILAGMA